MHIQVASLRQSLELPAVDYERTLAGKLRVARAVFDLEGRRVLASEGFKAWFEQNKDWLRPYTVRHFFYFLQNIYAYTS
jgi:4-alpha-glucanotransferase